jgi:hypothetical protein
MKNDNDFNVKFKEYFETDNKGIYVLKDDKKLEDL